MRSPLTLDKLARRTGRSGWVLAVICGISLLFSLSSPVALAVCLVGLGTGVAEIRRGGSLAGARDPRAVLRMLGKLQVAFSLMLVLYFGQEMFRLHFGDGPLGDLSKDDLALIEQEMPGMQKMATDLVTVGESVIAVLAVGWQFWVARRYFRLADNLPPAGVATGPEAFSVSFSADEIAAIRAMAAAKRITVEQVLHDAIYLARQRAEHGTRGENEPIAAPPLLSSGPSNQEALEA